MARPRELERPACEDAGITAARERQRPTSGASAARAWNAVLVLIVGAALIAQIVVLITGGADANNTHAQAPVPVVWRLVRFFSYFTVQANMIVVAAAVTLVAAPNRDGRLWRVLRLDALLGIFITGLVYVTLLAPVVHPTGLSQWINIGLHYFSPCFALIGWLLFGPRPRITMAAIAGAFGWPVAWIAYTFAHGALSGWYPYPFLDAGLHGYAIALRNTVAVAVIAVAIALAFRLLDRLPLYAGSSV
jgi:hypothetical protein